ncbi:hypothetical protein NQ318_016089 [Aromia moschata]|uniref:Uncharacterized protein n=1 Tax=Aromia moschata TaxID=1265417 RepID=A0AAV8XK03_9CUCU|nr:hypothetical protein NQ318_016089 [Aromia moschata]
MRKCILQDCGKSQTNKENMPGVTFHRLLKNETRRSMECSPSPSSISEAKQISSEITEVVNVMEESSFQNVSVPSTSRGLVFYYTCFI